MEQLPYSTLVPGEVAQGVSKPETQRRKVDDKTGYFKQYDIKRARSFKTKWREPGREWLQDGGVGMICMSLFRSRLRMKYMSCSMKYPLLKCIQ